MGELVHFCRWGKKNTAQSPETEEGVSHLTGLERSELSSALRETIRGDGKPHIHPGKKRAQESRECKGYRNLP